MGHFFSKVSLFIDKKEAAAHLILDQDFATAPFMPLMILFISYCYTSFKITIKISDYRRMKFPNDDSIHSFIKYSSINVNFSLTLPVLPLGFAIADLISGFASNFILME